MVIHIPPSIRSGATQTVHTAAVSSVLTVSHEHRDVKNIPTMLLEDPVYGTLPLWSVVYPGKWDSMSLSIFLCSHSKALAIFLFSPSCSMAN